ncbi:acyltransferase [Pseudomonas sp. 21TX0197]|uniref:acyltransferase family protein n=1 Tax=Pseudomonas TaxID=286 RepID=UPI0009103F46|nr:MULTISPECIES: acyltransferase [Pseudomonas]MDB6442554.1 acyltransferase [Pseudomonas sp. 21TX0197]MDT8909133.1 acyltransferase [Pseudomonas prosekii]ROO36116.1 acyltransferase [Pseudomonas sp. AF76]ROO40413.1 acyltransferase [Pseudomonas sp. 7SR1]SFY00811.1 Peptidoglycan/LPS O-acetylase OafA/YrhL, contains acyltransferase and SGNH-hydrolase domains [Pseudomonas sp. NFACC36]
MTHSRLYHNHANVRLDSLTGFRFVAAALVFFFHASLTKIIGFNPFADQHIVAGFQRLFSVGGWLGVSFFFVLSGFVITWSARRDDTLGAFWRRRLVKIYPNHLVTFVLAMILFAVPLTAVSAWLPNLLLVHAWVPDMSVFLSVNGPSWSLCCELVFYLAFPFLLRALWKVGEDRLWLTAGLTVCAMAVTHWLIAEVVDDAPQIAEYPISLSQWWLAYYFPPLRLFEFVLGMLMARILMTGRWIAIPVAPTLALAAATYFLAGEMPFIYSLSLTTVIPIALLITSLAAADVAQLKSWFRHPLMVWLGEISFGFYMVHLLIMMCVTSLLDGQRFAVVPASLILAATFCLSILGGWLLFAFVERPAMRRWGKAKPIERPMSVPQV